MQKSKWLNSLLALLVVFISFSAFVGDFEDEEDLIKTANKHFSKGEYAQCVELFSQLVSNHPQNPNYNFKYGTCLLFSTEDKEQAIRFLKFAINKGGVVPEAYFFYGRALHLNYQFSKAKAQYIKFRSSVKPKVSDKRNILSYIKQCSSAEKLIDGIQKINVIHKKKVSKSEFFRSYRLGSMQRSIIVKPEEFQTKGDKKANEYSLIVHNAMNEVVYVSGYSKKDGIGGKDIFKIQKMPDGTFSKPINIGPKINTAQDEDFPYLHPNGRVLYFASKGHNSIGGYDIFRSELDTLLNLWGNAVNVGFAVNSPDDDVLYVSDMDENIAYFASSRENKLGEITVYKILPNSNDVPAVIVRGEILIKGSNQNKAKVVVYDQSGEEVGVYSSQQQSGAFTMTLEESSTFLIGVSVPGKTEKKVKLVVPAKVDESIISKKFVFENDQLVLLDNSVLLENDEDKNKIIAESAVLKVNQSNDVEFNTKIKKKEIKKIPSELERDEPNKEIADTINLIASAKEELDEIKNEEKKIKKQIDATYFVAQKKKIKSNLIKSEIEDLSQQLSEAYSDSDKEIKRGIISKKQKQLKIVTTQAVSAIEFAEIKEKELKIKLKEIESAEEYLKAVKKAEKSNNSLAAITEIEKAKDNLDLIQEQIKKMKEDDGSAKTSAKIEIAKKNVATKEVAFSIIESDIIDIEREKKDLAAQAKSTRNKGLKEELMLQIEELVQESKYKYVEKGLASAALTEARSELDVLESSKHIFTEINEEALDEGLVIITENQKLKIQEEVAIVQEEVEISNNKLKIPQTDKEGGNSFESTPDYNQNNKTEKIKTEVAGTSENKFLYDLKKAKEKKKELDSIIEEKELLELSLNGPRNSKEKKNIKKDINELSAKEIKILKDIRNQINKLKKQKESYTDEDKISITDGIEELSLLERGIDEFEKTQDKLLVKGNEDQTEKVITNEIEFDIENISDDQIEKIVVDETKIIIYDFSSNEVLLEEDIEEITKLKKEALTLLQESNLAKIESEKKGKTPSSSAKKLKQKAIKKLISAANIQSEVNSKVYSRNSNILENEIINNNDLFHDTLKYKAEEVKDLWTKASLMRSVFNKNKDEERSIELINKIGELEKKALDLQNILSKEIESRKEIIALLNDDNLSEIKEDNTKISNDITSNQNQKSASVSNINNNENFDTLNNSTIRNSNDTNSEKLTKEDKVLINNVLTEDSKVTINENFDTLNNSTNGNSNGTNSETLTEEDKVLINNVLSEDSKVAINENINTLNNSTNDNSNVTNSETLTEEDKVLSNNILSEDSKVAINENINRVNYYDKGNPNEKDILIGNEEGYGIERESSFPYGPSSKTNLELAKAKELERQAVDYYYQSEQLKRMADNNVEDKEKNRKEADKLLKKGKDIQAEANSQYQKVNEAEIKYNTSEIAFALEYEDIVKTDSAKLLAMEANSLFEQAVEIRKSANKEKSYEKSSALVNKAYQLELKAIKTQNYILSGELDGIEDEDLEGDFVNEVKKEENEYTEQATDFRILARKETDKNKKKMLLAKARKYELAGNTNRTKRMQEELINDNIAFKKNRDFIKIARKQSNNNKLADKAYDLELEADSLFVIAEDFSIKSFKNNDQVTRMEQIENSKKLMAEAKEIQNLAIKKYQESKFTSNDPGFIAKFRLNVGEKSNDFAVNETSITSTESEIEKNLITKETINDIDTNSDLIKDQTNISSIKDIEGKEAVKEGLEITTIEDEKSENVKEDFIGQQGSVNKTKETSETVSKPLSVQQIKDSYTVLSNNANKIEKEEVIRISRIENLKKQSIENKEKSEELLSQVDTMQNESIIMEIIAEANTYRAKGEEQELAVKNEEIILKNNLAEISSMRREANLILDGLAPEVKTNILSQSENNSTETNKINEFIVKENNKESTTDSINIDTAIAGYDEKNNNSKNDENTERNILLKDSPIKSPNALLNNLEDVKILGEGSVVDLHPKDEFNFNKQKTYSKKYEIPVDNEMPEGIIFQVQVGAFRNSIDPAIFNGLSPLVGERTSNGIIRYKVGYFRGFKSANMAKGRIRNLGYKDAFVVVFFNGKRITIPEAQYAIDNAKESEKFVYENVVLDEVEKLKKLGITEAEGTEDPIETNESSVFASNSTNKPITSVNKGLDNDLLNVGGVFFTVQVGVYRLPIKSSDLFGVSPLFTEKLNSGLLRYSTGIYRDYSSADIRKADVRNKGVKDAFIIAYNGKSKISTNKAKSLLNDDTSKKISNDTSMNIIFKVQVGAFAAPIVVENTPRFKDLTAYPFSSIKRPSGLLIYMVGSFKNKTEADELKKIIKAAGVNDCFVVALQNGKRIPMKTALSLQKNK